MKLHGRYCAVEARWPHGSALDSGSNGPSSDRRHCVVFLVKTLDDHGVLFTQVYKWVPANLVLGVTL